MLERGKSNAWREVFSAFLKLGLTAFGGPIAHLAYFRDEFVVRRQWLDDAAYAELVSLCQFLPGPASSQVGMALGFMRAKMAGAIAAWLAFTLPSALLMIALGLGIVSGLGAGYGGALQGLKVSAVAVVAQAVWTMAQTLCPDLRRRVLAGFAAAVLLLFQSALAQVAVMAIAGAAGRLWLRDPPRDLSQGGHRAILAGASRRFALTLLALFAALLIALPLAATLTGSPPVQMFDAFYRAGALVFGGGHVVLPVLREEVVPAGWISDDTFLAGYALAQVVPGPLFTFAGFVGAASSAGDGIVVGVAGGIVALIAIFLPAFLLVLGALPFWQSVLQRPGMRNAVAGINAGVVGVLLAALITPVGSSALHSTIDVALALLALAVLQSRRAPVWVVAAGCAVTGAVLF